MGIGQSEIVENPAIYEAYSSTIMQIIQDLPQHWNTIFIFGHNPTFTMLANSFKGDYIANVPTCGVVKVIAKVVKWSDFSESTGSIKGFYFPKEFK